MHVLYILVFALVQLSNATEHVSHGQRAREYNHYYIRRSTC